MASTEFFVSTTGSDLNPGTIDRPFRTITKGISVLEAGDVLNLRDGVYVESIDIEGKHGSPSNTIVIRSFPGEHARIEGCVAQFREAGNGDWEPASRHDRRAHPEEFVSAATFTPASADDRVNRGAFLDREPYTRLITYSQIDDLRADNQTFDRLPLEKGPPGPEATDATGKSRGFRRPWVYMGPGLFFDQATMRVHVRLSHTTNGIDGLADYNGDIDPRQVRLAISHKGQTTLVLRNSSFLRFENLSIRFGGEHTVQIRATSGIVFDRVRIRASSHGVFMGPGNQGTVFHDCEFDGGVPTWYFRTDRKAQYHFRTDDTVALNLLGKQTSRALLFGNPSNTGLEFHNCEFVNAHDLYLFGREIDFHHNWLHNLNDEALFLDAVATENIRVHHNVISQCLSAISFAGNKVGGRRFIYRNLIDLRRPTAGRRPRFPGDTEVFRFGHLYKSNRTDGPLDLFQNTCLVLAQEEQASYMHYRNTRGEHARRSFNNSFVAVNPAASSDRPISFVPPPSFPGPTDGNCYFRIGEAAKPLFRFLGYAFGGEAFRAGVFQDLVALRGSQLFEQSKVQYQPGYEANSLDADPRFRQIAADGEPQESDDLRLRGDSPARQHGIALPPDLDALDGSDRATGRPDVGCYRFGAPGLRVGVDGRRRFPAG